jgi:hypothetical protein
MADFVADHVEGGRLRGGDELLVIEDAVIGGDVPYPVVHDDDVTDRLHLIDEGPQDPEEAAVRENDLVLSMIGDVDHLICEQADVERVQHPPGTRSGEVQLQVTGGVPCERGDPPVGRHAE